MKGNKMTDTKKMAKKKYTCPLCKFESEVKDFLVNPNFRYVICKECGNMFMDKEEIERIAAQIKVEQTKAKKECPLCKVKHFFSKYLHNKEHGYLVCPTCGNVFMLLEQISAILDEQKKKQESRIITL